MKRSAAIALNQKAWGLFLLAVVLAAVWFAVNLLVPNMAAGPVPPRLVLILAWNIVFFYGLWEALARAGFSPLKRAAVWFTSTIVLTAWIAAVWTLAASGIFQQSIGNVPTIPIAIILPILIGLFIVTRSQTIGTLLDATPPSWLVGLQLYRILGAIFLVEWIRGTVPSVFALPAGFGDVATGLLALPAAVWVASGSPLGRSIGIRWNLLGLTDFAIAVTLGMLTSPGPAHLLAREHPNTMIATFPSAMIPAFVVPFSTLLHVLSLRQLKCLQNHQQPINPNGETPNQTHHGAPSLLA